MFKMDSFIASTVKICASDRGRAFILPGDQFPHRWHRRGENVIALTPNFVFVAIHIIHKPHVLADVYRRRALVLRNTIVLL